MYSGYTQTTLSELRDVNVWMTVEALSFKGEGDGYGSDVDVCHMHRFFGAIGVDGLRSGGRLRPRSRVFRECVWERDRRESH